MRTRSARRSVLAMVASSALLLISCAGRNPGDPIQPGFNSFSKEQDIQLGREAAAQVRQQVQIVQDERLQSYIQNVGRRLASQPEADTYPYSFTLINDPSINAFALPGGPIFVHSGLLSAAENEAEMAGVLAHEISHVALRHATNQMSKANLLQLPAVLAGAALGQESMLAQLGQLGLGLGLNAVMMKYSRTAETQSDALGTRIMSKAGYNPLAMADFFETLAAEGGSRAPEFLSSHPDPGNRREAVLAEIRTLPPQQYNAGSGDFAEMKNRVGRLPESNAQRARVQPASGVAPTEFVPLNARNFFMVRPSQWRVIQDQRSNSVMIAPERGIVQNRYGGMALGYGVVLSYYRPRSRNLAGATQELLGQLQSGNPNLQAGNTRRVSVNGDPALVSELIGLSPFGGRERSLVLTAMRPEGLFYMVFVAPEGNSAQLQPVFDRIAQSLRFN